jgi:hypothetical protein
VQALETSDSRIEPALQGGPLPSLGEDKNSESEFADNERIDGYIRFVHAKPLDNLRIGR